MNRLKIFSFAWVCVIVCILAVATILEKMYGSDWVRENIYSSFLFALCWAAGVVASAIYIIKTKQYKRLSVFMLHASFVVILLGAAITWMFGESGVITLRQGIDQRTFMCNDTKKELPFTVKLTRFGVQYYAGTASPSDYTSLVQFISGNENKQMKVSMNNIAEYKSYRFYQQSYDSDMRGTILAVTHDPWGIAVTYSGYALLLISMIWFMLSKKDGYRRFFTVAIMFLMFSVNMNAESREIHRPKVLDEQMANQFCDMYVMYHGRICQLHTVARDFTLKLYGKSHFHEYTAEQVLTGWIFYAQKWGAQPLIKIKSKYVQRRLGLHNSYACWNDYIGFDGNKLTQDLQDIQQGKKIEDKRGVEEANEKYNIIAMLVSGDLLKIYPVNNGVKGITWYSQGDKLPMDFDTKRYFFIKKTLDYVGELVTIHEDKQALEVVEKIKKYQVQTVGNGLPSADKVKAENIYNKLNYTLTVAIICIVAGLVYFFLSVRHILKKNGAAKIEIIVANIAGICVFVYLTAVIGLRWYIGNHLPISNGYETMQFMAWCTLLLTMLFQRKYIMLWAFGFLIAGLVCMVAMIGESNPQITPLMPVLASPLLSLHVAVIMLAYSLLAFIMLNGITGISLHYIQNNGENEERLRKVSMLMMYPAVFLLTIGIFIGAVWANVSWGRYWGWDPKEVWALITMMVYSLSLHGASLPMFRKPINFHVFAVVAFLTVLMTYFGVNFILGGMHSYANS